jgi:hypothetical protein
VVPTTPPSKYMRCRLCGAILPGWLVVFDEPDGTMLLHHLRMDHRTEVGVYLDRMHRTEDIGTVAMEAFERIEAP